MNEKKFCFIMCVNRDDYREEALLYISLLRVPEGYEIQVLTVEQATSMTAGYNEGMAASDAKYKIYLHQDVFLLKPDFMQRILDIFQRNETIGMIGMVGVKRLPEDGIMWNGVRCGNLYGAGKLLQEKRKDAIVPVTGPWQEVDVVDGLLMATQYDIVWREDILKAWDFYDVSQCLEFHKRGYQVVVPYMEEAWCYHDCGFVNLANYDRERTIFLKEYGALLEGRNVMKEGETYGKSD